MTDTKNRGAILAEQEAFLKQPESASTDDKKSAKDAASTRTVAPRTSCCLKCCLGLLVVTVVVVTACVIVVFVDAAKPIRCGVASTASMVLAECQERATLSTSKFVQMSCCRPCDRNQ